MRERTTGTREVIALFPLATVLWPGKGLPLHVFEPRYCQLLHDLQDRDRDERCFGVLAIRSGHEVGTGRVRARYEVGTAASLRDVEWLPDGRARVLAVGGQRFRVLAEVPGRTYDQGDVEWLATDGTEPDGTDLTRLAADVATELARYRAAFGALEPPEPAEDPSTLAWAVAAAMVLDLPEQQALLELPGTAARLRAERSLLRRENALMRALPSRPAVELPRDSPNLN